MLIQRNLEILVIENIRSALENGRLVTPVSE